MPQHRPRSSYIILAAYGLLAVLSLNSFAAAQQLTISDPAPKLFFDDTDGTLYLWEISADNVGYQISDDTAGTFPFYIGPGAPSFSLVVAASGRIGIGTLSPAAKLHVSTTDLVSTLRLESTSASPHVWDMEAGALGFDLFDATNGSYPLTVRSGAPTDSLFVDSVGNVGFGLSTPTAPIHVKKAAQVATAEILARFEIADDSIGKLEVRNGSTTDGIFHPRLRGTTASQAVPLTFEGLITTDVGVNPVVAYDAAKRSGGAVVTRPLVVYRNNGVSQVAIAANGVVTATSFNPVSSRTLKHDIEDLDSQEAANALRQLAPVKFIYNDDESNQKRVGFIAEDVPEVVAAPDRQSVPIMDVVALVTRVVKDQQQTIDEQKKTIERQQERDDQQQKTIDELIKRLASLEASAGK